MKKFTEHFKNLANPNASDAPASNEHSPQRPSGSLPRMGTPATDRELNAIFIISELKKRISFLKASKAGGLDFIKNELLKNCSEPFLALLTRFFNSILVSGIFPDEWSVGIIMPLHKSGDRSNPDNYRGISLLSCIGKLFTSLLNARLRAFLDRNQGLGESQTGFRPGYSTMDHIFSLHIIIKMFCARKKKLFAAFVDFRKAFDLVNRSTLWSKLVDGGMSGRILTLIQNCYLKAKSVVRLNGKLSRPFASTSGVLQGDNLSPLLFAIYINDLEASLADHYNGISLPPSTSTPSNKNDINPEVFLKLFLLLYADDSVILAESAPDLQKALDSLRIYCDANDVIVNTEQSKEKTKILVFSRGKIRNKPVFSYGPDNIEVVFQYTYLGIRFSHNGEFDVAIEKRLEFAKVAMYKLLRKSKKLALTADTRLELFERTVLPVALYGCEVWGFSNKVKAIDKFYRSFIKETLKLDSGTPSCMVYGETGTIDVATIIKGRMIGFWVRLVNSQESKLSHIIYKLAKEMHQDPSNPFKSSWFSSLSAHLAEAGLDSLLIGPPRRVDPKIVPQAKKTFISKFKEQWQNDTINHERCGLYNRFKFSHNQEDYMKTLSMEDTIKIAQLRTNNCNLMPTNKFKYSDDDIENIDLSCPLCHSPENADEIHYLFKCPFFTRPDFNLPDEVETNNGFATFIRRSASLFSDSRTGTLSKLARFTRNIEFALKNVKPAPLP